MTAGDAFALGFVIVAVIGLIVNAWYENGRRR